jgi:hypothetical protein
MRCRGIGLEKCNFSPLYDSPLKYIPYSLTLDEFGEFFGFF